MGVANGCYDNALRVVGSDPARFTYVEGYGLYAALVFPVWHAWVLDHDDGLAFDPTPHWPSDACYWGLAMPFHAVHAARVRNGCSSVFEGDWQGDFHFIREGWQDCV